MKEMFRLCRVVKRPAYRLLRDLCCKIKGTVCAPETRIINYVVKSLPL